MGCLYPISFWGTFHLFLMPSSLPLVLISHIHMSWILDWPGRAIAYPYWLYSLSKPRSSPTAFPQKKDFRKSKLKLFDLQLLPRLPLGVEVGWPVRDTLKNNIRLPETGRITLIMFKPTIAGGACKASILPSGSGTWGRGVEEFSENWFRGLLTLSSAHQSITSNEHYRL